MAAGGREDRDRARAAAHALVHVDSDVAVGDVVTLLGRLCAGAVASLPLSGAVVNLMSGARDNQSLVASSDPRASELVEVQFTTGEGPCHDAFATRRPVLVADLATVLPSTWPTYAAMARQLGVRSVSAFPLLVGSVRLGVLDLFADRAGALAGEDLELALALADLATEVLLDGGLHGGQLDARLDRSLDYRAEIHQAQGMLMVQLGIPVAEALVRMRAHAFGVGRPLADVAREIVEGRIFGADEI